MPMYGKHSTRATPTDASEEETNVHRSKHATKTAISSAFCLYSRPMGLKMGERYVITIGILFLSAVSFLSLYLLPSSGTDELLGREHIVPRVRDLEARRLMQEKQAAELQRKAEEAGIVAPPIPKPEIAAGDDSEARRITVKQMTKFAWDSYRKYAWGANELRPVSKTGHSASVFGMGDMGATIVDAIDTLWIMGLKEEYEQARSWIKHSLDFTRTAKGDLSVFETNIRFIGGLLSIYALTNDKMYVEKAEEIAKLLLPAFDTPTGIPYAIVNVATGSAKNYGWASGQSSILSEFGSLQLEFDYLSHVTGNKIYSEKIERIRDFLTNMDKPNGLYPLYLNPKTGKWGSCKHWLITDKTDDRTKKEYDAAVFAMEKKMLYKSEKSGLWYFANLHGSRVVHKMEHLACFSGGMFALQSANEHNASVANHYLDLAEKIAHTCHESYARTAVGLGPEAFRFTSDSEAKAVATNEKYYILRPEVVETWFYLWRITKQDKYREWAWNVVLALEKYAKVEGGYSGIRDVYNVPVEHDDVQQSFLFAELFKYLYLIFADDNVLPLNAWVFNTEAHPFPIRKQ
ncbi:glycosyl hydrolase family 47 [Teladorsagia circumcincta]|uniref:alpha-1,2-Mannosidase n=1 Tax=Teladorsagia circumcincta TaxID=45464 RepID=A0A2G9UFW4_TELCI|nr:glycosyl hydrolase family 47 [Teladorsagia circumcincta]